MTITVPMITATAAHRIRAAQAWLGLRRGVLALEELAQIEPTLREAPPLVLLQVEAHTAAKDWPAAIDVARTLFARFSEPDLGIIGAFVHYRLARCCFALGDRDRGRQHKRDAAVLEERYQHAEISPAFAVLWDVVLSTHCDEVDEFPTFPATAVTQPHTNL